MTPPRPQPFSFGHMSGRGFDFPPATSNSGSAPRTGTQQSHTDVDRDELAGSLPGRFRRIRRALAREREQSRQRNDAQAAERQAERDRLAMPPLGRPGSRSRRAFRASPFPPPRPDTRPPHDYDFADDFAPPSTRTRPPFARIRERARAIQERREERREERQRYDRQRARRERERDAATPSSTSGTTNGTTTNNNTTVDGLAELTRRAGERLADLNELLDTFSPVADSMRRQSSPPPGPARPHKRRKTSHDPELAGFVGVRYGYHGQVVPGRLHMEIAACDGGIFDEDRRDLYRAENVLKNDRSVYCTKANQCNLLLRHNGELPFSVQRIVIKAPERGFTAPIQEGLIFVAMDPRELMAKSSRYRISWAPPIVSDDPPSAPSSSSRSSSSSETSPDPNEPLSLLEAINDEHIERAFMRQQATQPSARRLAQSRQYRHRPSTDRAGHSFSSSNAENCDPPSLILNPFDLPPPAPQVPIQIPIAITTTTTNTTSGSSSTLIDGDGDSIDHEDAMAPFYSNEAAAAAEVGDENDDDAITSSDEEATPNAVIADRARREQRWMESSPDDDDDDDDESRRVGMDNLFLLPRSSRIARRTRWLRASRRSVPAWVSLDDDDCSPSPAVATGAVLQPNARFFIQKEKSRITIKFDPPVSGKFLLLKMWSPVSHGNIDIQSIAAYGYAGQRYFPAATLR